MKDKLLVVCQSFLWCIMILVFPVVSGILSAVLSLGAAETVFLQGIFMALSLVPPSILILSGKWNPREIGFAPFDLRGCKRARYFIPLLLIFVPAAVRGFYIKSAGYVLGCFFLYLFVGMSEEVYFRGVIPRFLKRVFSARGVILVSAAIFAAGHITAAFSCGSALEVVLSVLNAFLFGWMAMEMTVLSANLLPAILTHFLFDFETKITVIGGSELLIAEIARGILMFAMGIWMSAMTGKEQQSGGTPS